MNYVITQLNEQIYQKIIDVLHNKAHLMSHLKPILI